MAMSMSMSTQKSCVVTGATEGIGHQIVAQLAKKNILCFLTGKSDESCLAAKKQLEKECGSECKNVIPLEFNVQLDDSIQRGLAQITKHVKSVDYLVCNAAVSTRHTEVTARSARDIMDTNFYGYVRTINAFKNHLTQGGKLVLVGSNMGILALKNCNMELRKRLLDPNLNVQQLCELAEQFVKAVENNKVQEFGLKPFTHTDTGYDYAFSKLLILCLGRVLTREMQNNVLVNVVHPGYVKTGLTHHTEEAEFMPKEGALPIVKCLLECNSTGHYFNRESCDSNLLNLTPEKVDELPTS